MSRKTWVALLVFAALAAGVFFGVKRYRYRFVKSNDDLLRLVPEADASLFFAQVDALRAGGYLALLQGVRTNEEREYTSFVRETGFDYTKDLNALAGSVVGEQMSVALRGHFEWSKVRQYIRAHNGSCAGDSCRITTSTPGRWLGLRAIQPDVMALAIGADRDAVEQIRPAETQAIFASQAPVWFRPSRSALLKPQLLPLALRIFAISLESADSVVLALASSPAKGAAFDIGLDAVFANRATAETARDQLRRSTSIMKMELARDRKASDPADLTWLLTAGTFETTERHVTGIWPVRKELLAILQ